MNEATETIRKAANELTDDGQKEAADALLTSLTALAEVVQTSHEGSPDVAGAVAAFDAVDAAVASLRALVPALSDALDTVVSDAETAADSVPELVLSSINEDTSLREVVRLYKQAYADSPAHDVALKREHKGLPLCRWWLTYNRDTSIAKAMLGTGDAAEAARGFAGTLDDLCVDLELPRTSCCHVSLQLLLCPLLFHSPSTCCRVSTFCFIFFQANHWRIQIWPVREEPRRTL